MTERRRIAWLADAGTVLGGAELTQAEFRAAAPEGVEIIDCPPGKVADDCDLYLLHNCVTYDVADLDAIRHAPAFKYWNDVGGWYPEDVRALLDRRAVPIYCSPLQERYMNPERVPAKRAVIPPPIALERFEKAALAVNGNRAGSVCVASWRNLGKGPQRAAAWAADHGGVDYYGSGPFAPPGSRQVAYQGLPALLARYHTFVFLPTVIEPFGRAVAEAWAAGCEIVVNNLVGARHWIESDPDAIRTAAGDYWQLVLSQ